MTDDDPHGFDDDEKRGTVLFTVSADVAKAAIAQVASCEACNPEDAEIQANRCGASGFLNELSRFALPAS